MDVEKIETTEAKGDEATEYPLNPAGFRGKVLILGPGRLGQHLALELSHVGQTVRLHGRRASDPVPGVECTSGGLNREDIQGVGLIILTISDGAIEGVATSLAEKVGSLEGVVVLHTSGQKNATALEPLRVRGAATGSFHPLQSFSLPPKLGTMEGAFFAIEGDERARMTGKGLAAALGGWSRELPAEAKVTYHAAAVVASNLLIALADCALEIASQAGLERDDALQMLTPLMEGSLKNLKEVGLPASLTGPISRGDASVVEAHVNALHKSPELLTIYRTLSKRAVKIAAQQGLSSPEDLDQAASLLGNRD